MTREEAIERIKSRYDKWALDDKDLEAIQCTFPELMESEDERIRKFLIDILSSGVWRTEWPFSPVDCVAYLEKQKEQQPAEWSEEDEDTYNRVYYLFRDAIDEWYKAIFSGCYPKITKDKVLAMLKSLRHQPQPKQEWSEDIIQKAVKEVGLTQHQIDWFKTNVFPPKQGWSEEDEKALERAIDCVRSWEIDYRDGDNEISERLKSLTERFNLEPKQEWSKEDSSKIGTLSSIIFDYAFYKDALDENNDLTGEYAELDNWLGYLPERFNLPPKQEWSEEDEHRLTDAIYFLKSAKKHYADTSEIEKTIDWLKFLRPQPKQNANDMITPNKKFFQWIYDRLVNVHKENPNVDYMISFKRRIEELWFDEPHWKPSEEQMDALKNVAYGYYQEGDGFLLHELHEQLKKLM